MSATTLNCMKHKKMQRSTGRKPSRLHRESLPAELREPIAYVTHPAFRRKNAENLLQRLAPLPESEPLPTAQHQEGLTFVAGFVGRPLLTPAEEQALFAWMNFHRFRAEQLRRKAVASKSPQRATARMREELAKSNRLRNWIVSSNLRLVVSLAKKLASSLDQMSELISEGVVPLIRAAELFDISLGNRFSTYATWAVRNQMLRNLERTKTAAARWGQPLDVLLESLPAPSDDPDRDSSLNLPLAQVRRVLSKLPDRERLVLQARFGLDGEPQGQSLADVADRVGLSKERVRQLVEKSLEAIRREFAGQLEAA